MDDNVMKTYTTVASQPKHFVQYDQGEDRWLCTLMLQRGWRIEYSAASDSFTGKLSPDSSGITLALLSLSGYFRWFLHPEETVDALHHPQYYGSSGELENCH